MDKWFYAIIKGAVSMASPEILDGIRQSVQDMVDRAKKSPNKWDDMLAGFLQMIVGKPGTKKE